MAVIESHDDGLPNVGLSYVGNLPPFGPRASVRSGPDQRQHVNKRSVIADFRLSPRGGGKPCWLV